MAERGLVECLALVGSVSLVMGMAVGLAYWVDCVHGPGGEGRSLSFTAKLALLLGLVCSVRLHNDVSSYIGTWADGVLVLASALAMRNIERRGKLRSAGPPEDASP